MKQEDILKVVQAALKGIKKVKVTFKPKMAYRIAYYLVRMHYCGLISFNSDDNLLLKNVIQGDNLDGDKVYALTITFTDTFKVVTFLELMENTIDTIEIVS